MNVWSAKSQVAIWTVILLVTAGCSKRPHTSLSSSAAIIIQPGACVGPVRSEMTAQQVIDEIGEPERKSDSSPLYDNLGFWVNIKNGKVHTVLCVDPAGKRGGFGKAFAGRTSEGIGLGSSRADISKAYGVPERTDTIPRLPGDEVLRYQRLGLVFFMHNGKVESMAVIF